MARARLEAVGPRLIFYRARKAGQSVLAASKIAQISYTSGRKWEEELKSGKWDPQRGADALMSKIDLLSKLQSIIDKEDTPEVSRLAAIGLFSKMQGFDAPTQIETTLHEKPRSVEDWLQRVEKQVQAKQLDKELPAPAIVMLPPGVGETEN